MATNTAVQGRVAAATASQQPGLWSDAFGRLLKNRLAILGLILVILLLLAGIFGPIARAVAVPGPGPRRRSSPTADRPLPPLSPEPPAGHGPARARPVQPAARRGADQRRPWRSWSRS